MPNTPLRAAGYRRVSMGEQVEGHSLNAQAAHIQAYITAQNWHLVELYTDAGISAKKDSTRPDFERLLADARAGRFDVVVVDKIDRFSRHLGNLLTAIEQLTAANIAFVSVQEHLDLTTPWGKLMLTVLGMLAEIYIDNLRQETRKGKVQRARDGLWNGNIPFGYCKGCCTQCRDPNGPGYCPDLGAPDKTDGKQLAPHPVESLAVKLAFKWYVTGQFSDGQIADKLNDYVHLLPDGSAIHFRTKGIPNRYPPGQFTKDAVRELLQRRFYIGEVVYRSQDEQGKRRRRTNIAEAFQGRHVALVDADSFDKAQELRQTFSHSPRFQYNRATQVYPLSGLLRCGRCGRPMRAISSGGRRYYQDVTRADHRGECEQLSVRAEDIEAQMAAFLSQVSVPEDWQARLPHWLGMNVQEKCEQALARWERVKELYLKGDIDQSTYKAEKGQYEAESANWGLTQTAKSVIIEYGFMIQRFKEAWTDALPTEKTRLLRLSLSAAYVWGNDLVAIHPTPALFPFVNFGEGAHCSWGNVARHPRSK